MTRKNRRARRIIGTGLGRGHGGNTPNLADIKERPLSAMERKWKSAGQIEQDLKGHYMGGCTITVGTSALGHHLSIAHKKRYPTWDEIAKARYELLPADVSFGMVFPPDAAYVNVHNNCFHLWEVTGLKEARKLTTVGVDMARALNEIHAAVNGDECYPDTIIEQVQAALEQIKQG